MFTGLFYYIWRNLCSLIRIRCLADEMLLLSLLSFVILLVSFSNTDDKKSIDNENANTESNLQNENDSVDIILLYDNILVKGESYLFKWKLLQIVLADGVAINY